ncbi:RNA-binding protein [Alteromonas sediminis]|uniref:RNA-binding protein n=1 Tax=Alteromonas sediminis TaxID=2259342 RepID=A0A3N5XYL0_9ALTE|nr:RNA-binding protein [Alteromonas sediminis]RPJ66237.1 RNA-binding protein [Alteromonas sediminis]
MSNQLIFGLVLSTVSAIGASLLFPNVLTPTPLHIAIYVFISCLVITFITTSGVKEKATDQQQENKETTTLYVGNLPYRANEDAVKSFFGSHVFVQSVRLMKDKRTGKRKGYGFIEVVSNDVNAVIDKLNDTVFQDRTLKVRPAKDKVEG